MAIVQISRITHRKGLMENLPQLAGGEFGWALDEQRLFIGNGTLAEGAPFIGNTEILTQNSDILGLAATYNYKGEVENPLISQLTALPAAQTGPTVNSPIFRSLQAKLDDFVSIKDFGAVGDGVEDDTDAINRALRELFCVTLAEETRRSLYFPAGEYKISGTIKVPPFAKLWGEGIESTVITYDTDGVVDDYVIVTADSLQQTDANIGENGAVIPQGIEVSSMSFKTLAENSVLNVDKTTQSYFDSVNFQGSLGSADVTSLGPETSCIVVESSANFETQHVTFNKCRIQNSTYGFYSKYNSRGITISNCYFDTLYRGVEIGDDNEVVDGGPRGVRIVQNLFDNVFAEGIRVSQAAQNISAYNLFLEVGNGLNGVENPLTAIINFETSNNASFGDLFSRSDVDDQDIPRIKLNNTKSIAFDDVSQVKLGRVFKTVGLEQIADPATSIPTSMFSINTDDPVKENFSGFGMNYNIKSGDAVRTGKIMVSAAYGAESVTFTEEYTETADTGVLFTVTQTGAGIIDVRYQNSSANSASIIYTVDKFII